jgi:hypothetical protein
MKSHKKLVSGVVGSALIAGTALLLMGQSVGPSLMASGKIASIDPQQKVLKLKTGLFTTREFMIEAETKISDGQQTIALEQLQPGAKAKVEYVQEGDKRVAQSVTVEGAVGVKPPEAKPAEPAQAQPSQPQPTEPQASPAPSWEPESQPPAGPESQQQPGPQPGASPGSGSSGGAQHPDIRY